MTTDLFAGLDLAVFEQQPDGLWQSVGMIPDWLDLPKGPLDLSDHFPLLDVFFPECEEVWTDATFTKRTQSDVWTEPHPRTPGAELYVQAVACGGAGRKFLALKTLPQALFTWQQLAHDFELEKLKVERLSQELEVKRREAERATEAKSSFLAAMSHEIRTPLNAIIGMADVLSGTPLNAEQQKCVDIFQRNGVSLLNLINDILDLSKVEAGHMELESTDFDLRDVISAAMEVVEVRVNAKALTMTQTLARGVPRYLTGDPNRLRQIMINLLGNSIKFTERGGLEIRVEQDPDHTSPDWLRFAISDTGIGIPKEKLGTIFESFSQADASTTRTYGGTGLGLSISRQLVELMGGRIWVESEVGAGSTFFFTAHFGVQEDQTERRPVAVPQNTVAGLESKICGLKILLVDDSSDNRTLILAYLKNVRSQIYIAENGLIATQMFRHDRYDAILMDVEMPVMDGYEATREIRRIEAETGATPTPVFALTAHAFADMAAQGYASGFTSLLTKPIRKGTLLEAISGITPGITPGTTSALTNRDFEDAVTSGLIIKVEEGMEDIVPGYIEKRRAELPTYQSALTANDFDTIRKLAHKMKGTGTGYGLPRLTEIGTTLEKAALASDATTVSHNLKELAHYLETIQLEYLK